MKNFLKFNVVRAQISTQSFQNQEHLVVPLVALVEQVIFSSNATQANLVLAEEFSKVPEGWNGRPVVVDHPKINGENVSANSPTVLESEEIGKIFNGKFEDNKLKMEAWINLATVEGKDDLIKEIVNKLKDSDEVIEISTGLFADVEEKEGVFNGEEYKGIWRNIVPDHLAILSEGKGACSIEHGCGAPRTNKIKDCSCGGTCDKCKPQDIEVEKKNETLINRFFNYIKDQRKKLSDVDKRSLLNRALRDKVSDFWMIEAIYNKTVVYYAGDKFYEQPYKVENDGSVTFEGDRIEVLPETRFVKVTSNRSNVMDKEKFVNALIDNKGTKFTKEHKDWLMDQEEATLEALEPVVVEPEKVEKVEEPNKPEKVEANAEVTVDDYLKSAPTAVRETLTQGMSMVNAKRAKLSKDILDNERNTFTAEQLAKKDILELEAIANLATVEVQEDYSARGGHRPVVKVDNTAPPAMPSVFDLKKTA